MSYSSMQECVRDLEKHGHLIRIKEEVDPNLEIAEIHRRVYAAQGPALFFEKIKNSPFPAVSNLYGTFDRTEFIFRHTVPSVKKVVELKADPGNFFQRPLRYLSAPFTALTALPMKSWFGSPVTYGETTIDQIPQIKSWPMDGGAFITLPQVFTLPPGDTNVMHSNIGMYRIQLSGNDYQPNEEIGLHYQLHRGIGVHHTQYNKSDEPFRCSIFVGGPPAHAFAAIMPLPEGLSELTFAGMLAGRRFRYNTRDGHVLSSDADFVITGTIVKDHKKLEGPFGDHLGYYSLAHDFPVMKVDKVYHRKDAIWHFTVVGRPPQEDTSFGYLIHKIVEKLTPQVFPGIREVNAVDAAGVHPLLLAIGSERYMPFREKVPEEILTQANNLLGTGQTSLAKFLIIAADDDDPALNCHDIPYFHEHVLQRIDWTRDLHFQTKTTMDTLDYSGSGWNAGSKVVIACRGPVVRTLATEVPSALQLPNNFTQPLLAQKGTLAIQGPAFTTYENAQEEMQSLQLAISDSVPSLDKGEQAIPLIVVVDDSTFLAATLNNYLWVTYTRANPSHDIYGVDAFTAHKHWGCRGALIIDARIKPHHAPPLVRDPEVTKKVNRLFKEIDVLRALNIPPVSV